MTKSSGDKVGHGNPPRATQFKKGVSGNPGGRPKKERDIRKLIEVELDQIVFANEGDKRIKITKREIIVKKLVNDAASGNYKALDRVLSTIARTSPDEDNKLIGLPAEVLASFLARHHPDRDLGSEADDGEDLGE